MVSPIRDGSSSIQQPLPLLKEKFDKAAGIMNGMNRTNEMIIELLADVAFQGKSETKEAFEDRKKYTREDVKDLERQFEVLTNMLKETYKEIEELEGISKSYTDIVNRETQPKRQTTTPPVVHSPSKQTAQTTSKTASQVLSGKSAHSSVAKPAPARAEPAPAAQEAVVQPPAQPPAAPAAAPPPPPPMPGKSPQVGKQGGADRSNLLDDIQKGKKLRKQPEGGTVVRQPREEAPAAPAATTSRPPSRPASVREEPAPTVVAPPPPPAPTGVAPPPPPPIPEGGIKPRKPVQLSRTDAHEPAPKMSKKAPKVGNQENVENQPDLLGEIKQGKKLKRVEAGTGAAQPQDPMLAILTSKIKVTNNEPSKPTANSVQGADDDEWAAEEAAEATRKAEEATRKAEEAPKKPEEAPKKAPEEATVVVETNQEIIAADKIALLEAQKKELERRRKAIEGSDDDVEGVWED